MRFEKRLQQLGCPLPIDGKHGLDDVMIGKALARRRGELRYERLRGVGGNSWKRTEAGE
jgi:hypothetical protein